MLNVLYVFIQKPDRKSQKCFQTFSLGLYLLIYIYMGLWAQAFKPYIWSILVSITFTHCRFGKCINLKAAVL